MSPLAFDKQGKPFAWHRRTTKLLVRMFRNPAARGTCCQVLDAEGEPLYIDAETEYGEFRKAVGNVPGLYRLDQCDDDGVEIDDAQPAYVSIDLTRNASLTGDGEVNPLVIIEHMFAIHADVMKTMAMQQASIMAASAEILRAPYRQPAPAVEGDKREADSDKDDDDDDDDELEPEPDPWAAWRPYLDMIVPHLPKLGALLFEQLMKMIKKSATPPPAAATSSAPDAPPASAQTAESSGDAGHAGAAAGSSPPSSATTPPDAASTNATSGQSETATAAASPHAASVRTTTASAAASTNTTPTTAAPTTTPTASAPSAPASAAPTTASVNATTAPASPPPAKTANTSVTTAAASAAPTARPATPSTTAIAVVPASGEPAPRNTALSPTPEQWEHLHAVRERLSPKERAIAENAIMRMDADVLAQYLAELSTLSVDAAVATIRSMIAKLRPTHGPERG